MPNLNGPKQNFDNLISQIIIEALTDDSEYLESDGAKFWLDLIDVDERRIQNALNFRIENGENVIANKRYIMERLDS